jgi:hypothetical protein
MERSLALNEMSLSGDGFHKEEGRLNHDTKDSAGDYSGGGFSGGCSGFAVGYFPVVCGQP